MAEAAPSTGFPDLGPIFEFREFTESGLDRGGFLFELISTPDTSLYFIALTFALIGGLSIMLMSSNRTPKVIIAWLFLVLVLIIRPYNESLLFIPPATNTPVTNVHYAPQLAIVDITSRLHRAIFDGFFTIGADGKSKLRNIIDDSSSATAFASHPNAHYQDNAHARQMIALYDKIGCGKKQDLYKAPFGTNIPDDPAKDPDLIMKDDSGKNKYFTLGQVKSAMDMYHSYFKGFGEKNVYAPFAVAYHDNPSNPGYVGNIMNANGVDESTRLKAIQDFTGPGYTAGSSAGKYLRNNTETLKYIVVNWDELSSATMNGNGVHNNSDFSEDTYRSDISKGLLNATVSGATLNVTSLNPFSDDIIEMRLDASHKNEFTVSEKQAMSLDSRLNVPVMLGLLYNKTRVLGDLDLSNNILNSEQTPGNSHYASLGRNDIMGNVAGASTYMTVVSNCAQLQSFIHNYLNEEIVNKLVLPGAKKYGAMGAIYPSSLSLLRSGGLNGATEADFPNDASLIDYETEAERALRNAFGGSDAVATNKEVTRHNILKNITMSAVNRTRDSYMPRLSVGSQDNAINASFNDSISEKLRTPANVISWFSDIFAEALTIVGSWFKGGEVAVYMRFLKLFAAIALLFVLVVTPITYLIGLLVPAYAPGIIIISLGAVLIIKMIPVTFTIIDAVISMVFQQAFTSPFFSAVDRALLIYIAATLYTSIVGITMFIMFKIGDASSLGQLTILDKSANEIADKSTTTAKTALGAAAVAPALATGGAAVTAALSGKSAGAVGAAAFTQGKEIFTRGLANLPGSNVISEVFTAGTEGRIEAGVIDDYYGGNAKEYKRREDHAEEEAIAQRYRHGSVEESKLQTAQQKADSDARVQGIRSQITTDYGFQDIAKDAGTISGKEFAKQLKGTKIKAEAIQSNYEKYGKDGISKAEATILEQQLRREAGDTIKTAEAIADSDATYGKDELDAHQAAVTAEKVRIDARNLEVAGTISQKHFAAVEAENIRRAAEGETEEERAPLSPAEFMKGKYAERRKIALEKDDFSSVAEEGAMRKELEAMRKDAARALDQSFLTQGRRRNIFAGDQRVPIPIDPAHEEFPSLFREAIAKAEDVPKSQATIDANRLFMDLLKNGQADKKMGMNMVETKNTIDYTVSSDALIKAMGGDKEKARKFIIAAKQEKKGHFDQQTGMLRMRVFDMERDTAIFNKEAEEKKNRKD